MDIKTSLALEGSIKKWENIVAGIAVNNGTRDCPLCQLFVHRGCKGCPVAEKSGDSACTDTPYYDYTANRSEKSARAMLNYLKDLRPPIDK